MHIGAKTEAQLHAQDEAVSEAADAGATKAPPSEHAQQPRGQTTRRQFLTYGAVGLATAVAGGGLLRWSRASAQTAPAVNGVRKFVLNMTHRIETMVDGTPLYMWVYEGANGGQFPESSLVPPNKLSDGTLKPDVLRRRQWASVFPDRVLYAYEGETIELTLTNSLSDPHNFTIRDQPFGPSYFDSGPMLPSDPPQTFTFGPLMAGTYVFEDDLDSREHGLKPSDPPFQNVPEDHAGINRSLGLHGVLVVSPIDAWTAFAGGPNHASGKKSQLAPIVGAQAVEFERQYVWILNDHDPSWNALAQQGRAKEIDVKTHIPRYFTINGLSGVDSIEGPLAGMHTRPCGVMRSQGDPGQLVRIVNAGIEIHGIHFHGNHVEIVRPPIPFQLTDFSPAPGEVGDQLSFMDRGWKKDIVALHPRDRVDVMIPFEPPRDCANPPAPGQTFHYPMHSHSEPSQTAGGGLYPGGQVTDWVLLT